MNQFTHISRSCIAAAKLPKD